MIIRLVKFGTLLTSRQAGREALAAFRPTLKTVKPDEDVILDFTDMVSLSPSWADEFITALHETFGARLRMISTKNPSVEVTLRILGLRLEPPRAK